MIEDGYLHTIALGDTTSGLAYEHGLTPDTIWNHSRNQKLKQIRQNMNVLNPGDQLYIPALQRKQVSRPVDQRHKFKRKGIPEVFRMRFVDYDDTPIANAPYCLKVDGEVWKTGSLDGDGWVRTPIPAGARDGEIGVGQGYSSIVMQLNFGYLNPLAEMSGLQARLRNLGFYAGPEDGQDSEEFRSAVREFRKAQQLPEGDMLDTDFRNALKDKHLS